ncbi:MAG: PAS domain-containing protein [Pseudomonadota bacterium]|nr:PAS domain-containing protein [Pseudomonadota bacterium]
MNEALVRQAERKAGIIEAFEAMPNGIIIFDEAGSVIEMNPAAKALLAAGDPLRMSGGIVSARQPETRRRITALMTETLRFHVGVSQQPPGAVLVQRENGGMPLRITAYAASTRSANGFFGVLQIRDMTTNAIPSADMILQATPLSQAEARLCHALLSGLKIADYAAQSGISEHTVRTQFKNVRHKLDAPSQADVLVTIMRLCGG